MTLVKQLKTENKRDVVNFLNLRVATPRDDYALGEFLVQVFHGKQTQKMPTHVDTPERIKDLLDVKTRRENGVVLIYELGYKIAATFTLIYPKSPINDVWLEESTLLRCVAVDAQFHGLSFSKLILDEADQMSYQMGAHYCGLHVHKIAPNVAQVYERHGYQRDLRGDHFSKGQEVLGYAKKIYSPEQLNLGTTLQ